MVKMMLSRKRLNRTLLSRGLLLVLVSMLLVNSAAAQDSATVDALTRDPRALAERYLSFTGDPPIPPLTPVYKVGDKTQFWVGKIGSSIPIRVDATLAADSPNVYLWVEDDVQLGPDTKLAQTALQLSQIVNAFRAHDNYRQTVNAPSIGALTDNTDLLPIPDVDNDPHLYILFAANLSEDRDAILNPIDSLPVAYAPYSNQHEMLYVNTTPYPGTAASDPIYTSMLVRAIYRWIMNSNVPAQATWLTEALDWSLFFTIQQTPISADNLSAYLQTPDTPLIQPPTLTTQAATLGEQQLFLAYFLQRYGSDALVGLFLQSGKGTSALDSVLAQRSIIDPISGSPVTGRDAFADFVMTNGLNLAFGDGRYVERSLPLPQGQTASATALDPGKDMGDLTVNQYGAQYFNYTNSGAQATTLSVSFKGSPTVARLPMPTDRDPADKFYWSGRGADQDTTLTRAIDLSSAAKATLTFDAWYSLAPNWNYGYVSVSTDNGATWKALPATTSANNQYGTNYGAGFTGISNPAKPHPFPTLGVVIEGDGVTVNDVVPGGAAATGGVKAGDVIIGYDNKAWTGTPNVIGLLANYAPGDTLHLYIQRGSQKIDAPVVLGAHPTRVVEPSPIWLAQSVNLTPYAGKQILLRFEAVSLPGHEDQGFAVDNFAIPEIQWSDKADGDLAGWTLSGWQQVDNQVAQQWIVQAGTSGTQTAYPRVQKWIDADSATSTGQWRISLAPTESLTIAVSGVNEDTTERATFNLGFKN